MAIYKTTKHGRITIADKAIATVVGNAALECYGVVGLSTKSSLVSLLKKDDFSRGVSVSTQKGGAEIDVYVAIAYGVKITEVLSEVQKKVRFVLQKTFSIKVNAVNVYARTVR